MRINDEYVLKNVFNSYILMNVKTGLDSVIKLNKTSKDIFDCVLKEMEYDEIIKYMFNKYDVEESTLKKDIDEYIKDMIDKGIFVD